MNHYFSCVKFQYEDIASKLQAIIDTAIDGIIVIDSRGLIEEINQSALNLFGYQKDELIGKNISHLMPSPHREQHDSYIQRYLDSDKAKIIGIGREVSGQKKDGSSFPFRLAVSKVELNDRIIFTGIIHDLSAIKKAQIAREKLTSELEDRVVMRTNELETAVNRLLHVNKQLTQEIRDRKNAEDKLIQKESELKIALQNEKELNELKTRFMSMASHEFRTPLSTIMSSVSLLSRYQHQHEAPKRLKHIERIKSSIKNLTGILNDFLSLSKLEEGKVGLDLEYIDVVSLCHEVLEDLEGMLMENQIIYIERTGTPFELYTDERVLKNILFNIISNAIKYSIHGGDIYCMVDFRKEEVVISVKDSGLGIPESEQHHLFDRFFRASNVDTIQGTGLGLSIVLKYLELIKGSIVFESKLNQGSTFIINISNYPIQ